MPHSTPNQQPVGGNTPLRLERKDEVDSGVINEAISMTPAIGEDYWSYRVIVGEHQAVVGFPKFGTIGIGFAVEEDWNTNLPYRTHTLDIWHHIAHNKGDSSIPDEWCIEAIQMIRQAAADDRDGGVLETKSERLYPNGVCPTCGSGDLARRREVGDDETPCSDVWHEADHPGRPDVDPRTVSEVDFGTDGIDRLHPPVLHPGRAGEGR